MIASLFGRKRKVCSTPEEVRAAFGEWLLRKGYCDAEAWETVLAMSGDGGVLKNSFYACNLNDTRAARVLAELSGLPFLNPRRLRAAAAWEGGIEAVKGTEMHRQLLHWHAIPLRPKGDRWPVAIEDPTDVATRAEILATLGEGVTFVIAPYLAIAAALDPLTETSRAMAEASKALRDLAHLGGSDEGALEVLYDMAGLVGGAFDEPEPSPADAPPAFRAVDILLDVALAEGVPALHLDRVEGELRTRLSIDGALHELVCLPRQIAPSVLNRFETLARITPGNRSQPAEGWFQVTRDRRRLTVVVDSVPGREGRVLTVRLYPPLPNGPLLELGVPAAEEGRLAGLLANPQGLFLIAGPTGSGRTRLLYTLAQKINAIERDVLVLDRVQRYPLPGASCPDCRTPEQVTECLEMALRAGTDAVVLWEVPPPDVLWTLLQAASEGTGVFLRVAARDAAAGIERLCRESGRAELLSRALSVAFGCRLLSRPCAACMGAPPEEGADPCPACRGRGTTGQVGFKEVLLPDAGVRSAIASRASASAIRGAAIEAGMAPLAELLRLAAEAGTVSREAAQRALAYR